MNYLVISILVIVVLILIYFLYKFFKKSNVTLAKMLNLSTPNPPITGSTIETPTSSRYSYSTWIYVNTWGSTPKTLFSIVNMANGKTLLDVVLGSTNLTLTTDISVTGKLTPIMVTNNFAVQKWVYLIISVDGSIVDIYLDGKLVLSTVLKDVNGNNMNSDVSDSPQINFGSGYDIFLSNFQRTTYAIDPQTAWKTYYAGNGQSNGLSTFGANLGITKNNILQRQVKIF